MKKRIPFEDDGRTVSDMSGINGYKRRNKPEPSEQPEKYAPPVPMSKREARIAAFAAVRAALLVVFIFGIGLGLFLLFCIYVWFR